MIFLCVLAIPSLLKLKIPTFLRCILFPFRRIIDYIYPFYYLNYEKDPDR